MNINELINELERLGISQELYSLHGGTPNEKLCLIHEKKWIIYYSERGLRTSAKEYASEDEACEVFLRKVKRYADLT